MSIGELVAFVALYLQLVWPIIMLGWLLALTEEAASALPAASSRCSTPSRRSSIPERPVPAETGTTLVFEDVRFRLPDDDADDVLRGVDLEHRAPARRWRSSGASGSGKTTLTALVPRLLRRHRRADQLGGVDVRDLRLDQLRHAVTTAFEDATLFSASVYENLTLGRAGRHRGTTSPRRSTSRRPASSTTCRTALDTRIGEQGLSLSGGQRQRLALARAVLGRPRVLVLDDPLSALDVHTEAQVEEALRRVLAATTALVVAHRPSTVLLADRVALLADGRIAAVGTHRELLDTVPAYRNLLAQTSELEG